MSEWTTSEWIGAAGIFVTIVIAFGTTVYYARARYNESKHLKYKRLFELFTIVGDDSGNVMAKMAASYELRKYKEYSEVIIRLSDHVEETALAQNISAQELKLTADYFKKSKNL